ncbi:MAG: hypothetical protein QOE30_5636 [Mycobacterium sp.]|uniref:hypothetical protein n=1 Tax=Mycobacterium sp. TaxID=1785 RepID=UPI0028B5F23C|nr:hypothetical protein [Mycobacterium sp.]MDT5119897.1 hypothetical protein [Mycobacterium sp.]
MDEPREAQRATTGPVLVAVIGVLALIVGIAGFAAHLVGFATDATIVGLLCIGAGLGGLTQDRRGRRQARRATAARTVSRRVEPPRRTTP